MGMSQPMQPHFMFNKAQERQCTQASSKQF